MTMLRYLSILFLLPCLCLGESDITCRLQASELAPHASTYFLYCEGGGEGDEEQPDTPPEDVLTEERCNDMKRTFLQETANIRIDLQALDNTLYQARSSVSFISANVSNMYQTAVLDYYAANPSQVYDLGFESANDGLNALDSQLSTARQQVATALSDLSTADSRIESYNCTNGQQCAGSGDGSGSVSCPCQTELQEVVDAINDCLDVQESIDTQLGVFFQAYSNMVESIELIRDRLKAPDDRMWSELQTLYSRATSNITSVSSAVIDLSSMMYDLRQLIRGDSSSQLQLSSEGVIAAHQLVFDMANYQRNALDASNTWAMLAFMTNRMARLFDDYSNLVRGNQSIRFLPNATTYEGIYAVFTNNSVSARTRYSRLLAGTAQVTNWFQRMEFYQQAALGWFDEFAKSEFETDQERLTESSLEEQIRGTTNTLGVVVSAGSELTNVVANAIEPVSSALGLVEIVASLPTQILVFPRTDLGSFGVLDDIYFDTSEIKEYCDFARSATTLVWKVIIWSLYVGVAVGIGRLLFLLVLFVIHFLQNL